MFDRFIPMVVPTYVIEEIRLEKKDIIVFCSDGVSDYVPLSYIRDVVSEEDLFGSIKTVIYSSAIFLDLHIGVSTLKTA